MSIALTGTTGKLGGRVARLLAQSGHQMILVGRDEARLPRLDGATRRGGVAYDELDGMTAALEGADVMLLVSANLSGRRLTQHATAIDAAVLAGVGHVVYISLLGAARRATYLNARDHWQTEQYLASSDVEWTVLRPSFYSSMLPDLADADGVVRGPAGEGTVSAVAHDDIARLAVEVLLDHDGAHYGRVYPVTGPDSVTLTEATRRMSVALGRRYVFEDQSIEQAYATRAGLDATRDQVDGWVSWYLAIANGEVALTTDDVTRLTGRPALSIEANLRTMGRDTP